MADTGSEDHIFHLSSIDQSTKRDYIKCCLCFARPQGHDIDSMIYHFTAAVKRTVTHLPILAGHVRLAANDHKQIGCVEVSVKLSNASNFQPIVKQLDHDDFAQDFVALARAGMPPAAFLSESLAPLADFPGDSSPVFAVQVNLIPGGVLVALYLHNSVGDFTSLGTVIGHLSSDLPTCKLTEDDLRDEAVEQTRLRDRLSGSRGVKADVVLNAFSSLTRGVEVFKSTSSNLDADHVASRILIFDMSMLEEVKDLINQRFQYIRGERAVQHSCFDALAAILWKGIARAVPLGNESYLEDGQHSDATTSLIIPLNVRKTIEPAMGDSYFGNATIPVFARSSVVRMTMPYDPGTLALTARSVRDAVVGVSEQVIRSVIASINDCSDVQSVPIMAVNPARDIVITSWAELDLENAHLGLDLGAPKFVRKVGRMATVDGCTIHPPQDGSCEVTVQLAQGTVETLLNDESFMAFVANVV